MPSYVDKEFDAAQANLTDIRAIIHALKMANLSFVEEDAATEIKNFIKNLPSAEKMNELADSSVNFICRPWVNATDYWSVYWDLLKTVKSRFDESGISIPYPQQDVHVKTGQLPAG